MIILRKTPLLVWAFFLAFLLTNCQKEITVDLPDPVEKIVVEGSIETGSPPFVILNRNYPYFGQFNVDLYSTGFVRDAVVKVSDGSSTVTLTELCWSELSDVQKEFFAAQFGTSLPDSLPANFDFCLYTLFAPTMVGQAGKSYTLDITTTDGQHLTANTTIPMPVPLDSVWVQAHNNPEFADTLRRLWTQLTDPDTLGNYYRYYTQRNTEPLYPGLRSVFDDLVINGKQFYFPLDKAQPQSTDFDIDTYGYFRTQDTLRLKWVTIDKKTYDFWRSLEFSANSGGPFSSIVQVDFNIEGGIGVWAGYSVSTDTTFVVP